MRDELVHDNLSALIFRLNIKYRLAINSVTVRSPTNHSRVPPTFDVRVPSGGTVHQLCNSFIFVALLFHVVSCNTKERSFAFRDVTRETLLWIFVGRALCVNFRQQPEGMFGAHCVWSGETKNTQIERREGNSEPQKLLLVCLGLKSWKVKSSPCRCRHRRPQKSSPPRAGCRKRGAASEGEASPFTSGFVSLQSMNEVKVKHEMLLSWHKP